MKKCCEFCGGEIERISRRTKKYCSDNCKQLAYYSRQGMNWGKNTSAQIGSPIQGISLTVKPVAGNPDSVKSNFTVSENNQQQNRDQSEFVSWLKEKEEELQRKPPLPVLEVKTDAEKRVTEKRQYQYVESALLIEIEQFREEMNAEQIFSTPENHWTKEAIESAWWVSVRFRCLLENILRSSNYKFIDRKIVQEISGAFNDLAASYHFKGISRFYPFSNMITCLGSTLMMIRLLVRTDSLQYLCPCMRLISFLLSIYVGVLSLVPCDDVHDKNVNHQQSSVQQAQDSSHSDSDVCSPFCTCSCCTGFTIFVSENAPVVITAGFQEHNIPFQGQISSARLNDHWQPPRVG